MAKSEFSIKKHANNSVTIKTKNYKNWKNIDLRNLTKIEQFELVKSEILNMGIFFSPKIEKLVRKELNFPLN